MFLSGPSAILAVLIAAAYVVLLTSWGERHITGRLRGLILTLVVLAAFVSHLNVLRWADPDETSKGLAVDMPVPHLHEIFHYYLGSKYFEELGYLGLYEAAVVADAEGDPDHFRPDALMRDLSNNRLELRRGQVLDRRETIKAAFSTERWQAFERDVASLRSWTNPDYWHGSGFYFDHGYNGTPFLTFILGGLANTGIVSPEHFLGSLRWLDDYLLVVLAAVLMGLDAAITGIGLLVFCFVNPLYDYDFVGNAYLRTDYLLPLVLGVLALRIGWQKSCGMLLALSGWLRIFPLALIGLLALHDVLRRDFGTRLRARSGLYLSFAATSLGILAISSTTTGPDGRNPWVAFIDNIASHSEELATNRIGLEPLLIHPLAGDRAPAAATHGDAATVRVDRERAAIERQRERRGLSWLASAGLAGTAVYVARSSPTHLLPIAWMLLLFAVQPLSHYYWAILAVIPVMAGRLDRRWHLLGGATLVALALTASPLLAAEAVDLRFALYSAEVLSFLLIAGFLASRTQSTQAEWRLS